MRAAYFTGIFTGAALVLIGWLALELFGPAGVLYASVIVGAFIFCAVFLLSGGGVLDEPMSEGWVAPMNRRDS